MPKKVYITESQFNSVINDDNRKNKKNKKSFKDKHINENYITTRVNKLDKNYSRKGKNKFKNDFCDEDF